MQKDIKANKQNVPESQERRTAMKKIAVGVGVLAGYSVLPEKWTQPIVGQISLPAHAATSGVMINDPCTVTLLSGDQSSATVTIRVDGFVTPPTANLPTTIVAQGTVTATTATTADGTFTADLTISGGPGITLVSVVTTVTGADGTASCSIAIPAVPTTSTTSAPGTTTRPTTTPIPTSSPMPTEIPTTGLP